MAEKKITRKVITKKASPLEVPQKVEQTEEEEITKGTAETVRAKRACYFCQNKTIPSYTDMAVLRRFVSDRAKILPRAKTSLCSKHQRAVTRHIKYARHLSLLPFTPKV